MIDRIWIDLVEGMPCLVPRTVLVALEAEACVHWTVVIGSFAAIACFMDLSQSANHGLFTE